MDHNERGLLRIPVLDNLMSRMGSFTDDQLVGAVRKEGYGLSEDQVRDYLIMGCVRGILRCKNKRFTYQENLSDKFRQPKADLTIYGGKDLDGKEVILIDSHPSRFFTRYSPN